VFHRRKGDPVGGRAQDVDNGRNSLGGEEFLDVAGQHAADVLVPGREQVPGPDAGIALAD
jgi:hypothetical protein